MNPIRLCDELVLVENDKERTPGVLACGVNQILAWLLSVDADELWVMQKTKTHYLRSSVLGCFEDN